MKWYTSDILPDFNELAPELCNSRSLESNSSILKASTTEEDENEEESVDMDVDKEKSVGDEIKEGKTGKAQSSNSANADGKLEYSRIRDANIAKNKKLLSDLGLLFPLGKGKDKATKKKGKKGSEGKKELRTISSAKGSTTR